jgi:hypothetical protein
LFFFLMLFEATGSEVLTVRDCVLEVAILAGWKTNLAPRSSGGEDQALRYELEAGLCFFAGPRTVGGF